MKRPVAAASVLAALVSLLMLSACSTTSPDVVSRNEARRLATVQDAVVLSTRPVIVEGSQSGFGGMAGSVIGSVAGSNIGGYRDSAVGAVLGFVLGGMIGNATERYGTREEAVEVLVQLRNGERRSIVQARASEALNPGDAVLVTTSGGRVRVTRAPEVRPAPVGAAANKG